MLLACRLHPTPAAGAPLGVPAALVWRLGVRCFGQNGVDVVVLFWPGSASSSSLVVLGSSQNSSYYSSSSICVVYTVSRLFFACLLLWLWLGV